ncbi:hypothetical protein ACIQI8_28570 [Streptomyces sp. NPDC092369]|uniref:hypothetical protein n=1 Tax=Streptomyces sp. NPDC092369 TaxID=3366015 RepID=UPI00380B4AA0
MGVEVGAQAARSRALAVLRIRSRALAVALLPAAVAVVLLAGGSTGHLVGPFWHAARWAVTPVAVVVLLAAGAIGLVVARARPAVTPTVAIAEESAPDLYRMVRDLADRLDVPAPSAIALTPDCDSWLEDRTHPAHGPPPAEDRDEIAGAGAPHRRSTAAPVLVIGSPFLWWMRVGELRAVLAPVVAGTGPSAQPDIAAARRFVRGLDAAVAVASTPGRCPLTRAVCAGVGWVARVLLRSCREHAALMERGVATAAAERAQAVDYGLRIVAQEQVGLAYAGWDRLLTRVALPAWRMGRWPSRLDAGVVAALTELSRRDRLAEGFASRLGERPACDLLEEPGAIDEATSLLAARLFHGGPAEPSPDWSPVDWQEYPDEVVDRKWRTDAARLHRVLDTMAATRATTPTPPSPNAPTLARILDHLSTPSVQQFPPDPASPLGYDPSALDNTPDTKPAAAPDPTAPSGTDAPPELPSPASTITNSESPAPPITKIEEPADGQGQAVPSADGQGQAVPSADGQGQAVPSADGQVPALPSADGQAPAVPSADGQGQAVPSADGQVPALPSADGQAPTVPSADDQGQAPSPADGQRPVTLPADARERIAPPADGEHAPQGPPALDDETVMAGTGGSEQVDGEAEADEPPINERAATLAAALTTELAREGTRTTTNPTRLDTPLWDDATFPLFPLQPPRTARELLTDHVTAMVCCAAMDTAGATPGLDWLDGPTLLVNGERATDLTPRVLSLVEEGDPGPLYAWLIGSGIRPEKPVRLV